MKKNAKLTCLCIASLAYYCVMTLLLSVVMYVGNTYNLRTFTFIFQILHVITEICKKRYIAVLIHYASHKLQATREHSYYDNCISFVIHVP